MMSKRKFTGVPFNPKTKCIGCKHFEQCKEDNNSLTTKGTVLDCEGFYYVFKELEKFEKYPTSDENIEKYTKDILAYEKKHDGIPLYLH